MNHVNSKLVFVCVLGGGGDDKHNIPNTQPQNKVVCVCIKLVVAYIPED